MSADLADLEPRNDEERAEAEWLMAREVDPAAPAPSPELAREYADLEDMLATLLPGPSGRSWRAAPSRPWWRGAASKWVAGGVVLAAAAAGIVLLVRGPSDASEAEVVMGGLRPDAAELEVHPLHLAVRRGSDTRGTDEAAVGDRLIVTARPRGGGDLRVYRADGALVARCPHGPSCRTAVGADNEYVLEIGLDAPVPYRVILVAGVGAALPESTMDVYLEAARNVGAEINSWQIDVH